MKRALFSFSYFFIPVKKVGRISALLVAFLLAACAGNPSLEQPENYSQRPKDDRLRHIVDMQDRLDRVSGALQIANADLCRNQVRNLFGFAATNKHSYSAAMTATASRVFGMGERLQVTNVIPGSGAQKAGLERGDILLTIEGQSVPQGQTAETETVKMLSPIVSKNSSVKMTVERNGATHELVIPLTRACGFRVDLGHIDNVNAYSDGQRILITRGMVDFAKNDNELAYVIAKEMAHNVLNHVNTLQTAKTNRKIIDSLIQVMPKAVAPAKTKPMSKQFDLDSDTLGLAMALRAGYEIDSAVDFWTRFIQANPASNVSSYTAAHPNSRARLELMPKSVSRIKSAEKRKKSLFKGK